MLYEDIINKEYFDYDKQITFGRGQRGCVQLLMDGYAYVKNNTSDSQIIWKCSKKVRFVIVIKWSEYWQLIFQGSLKCRAKVCTDLVDGVKCLTDIKGVHNHPVDVPRKVRTRKKGIVDEDQRSFRNTMDHRRSYQNVMDDQQSYQNVMEDQQ